MIASVNPKLNLIEPKLAYTVDETAHLLSLSVRSVHRLRARGLLRGSKALRRVLFSRVEIENFLKESSDEVK